MAQRRGQRNFRGGSKKFNSPSDGPGGPGEAPEKPKSSEPKIVATFIIDKIIAANESVKVIEPDKSQAERNNLLFSISLIIFKKVYVFYVP